MNASKSKSHVEESVIDAVETELSTLWSKVSTEEKMTNGKLEKKFGLLQRILQGLRDCNDRMQLGPGYVYPALDPYKPRD